MKRLVLVVLAFAAVLSTGCPKAPEKTPSKPEPSRLSKDFHSPIQPLDRGVLSSIPSGHRDFRRDPPLVQTVTAQPAGDGNVRLEVRVAEKDLPRVLTIETEDKPVSLHDDGTNGDTAAGDQIFTAVAPLPPEFLRERQAVTARLLTSREEKIFVNRELVPVSRLQQPIDKNAILSPFKFPFGKLLVNQGRSLMITDPGVVNDPTRAGNPCVAGSNAMGPWSFGHLIDQMSTAGVTGPQLAQAWLNQWMVPQFINGPPVPARPQVQQIINDWMAASGGGQLDLSKAPFHLLAIVNRMDLGDNPGYGGSASAGELRFVFGLLNGCNPTPFAVIFEYGLPNLSCKSTRSLAQQWLNLGNLTPGTPAYNAALQALTDPVVAQNAAPQKPNGSALNQLRTNEIFLTPPWELREFRLDSNTHRLEETTVKQTPIAATNNTATVANYVNTNQTDILLRRHIVPLTFPGMTPFLAGNAPVAPPNFWEAPGIANNDAASLFSLSTCNGCHFGETNTPFVHINPNTPIGSPAALSGFLTGITLADPRIPATQRTYHDLQDRANKLSAKASSPCLIFTLFNEPLHMVH